MHHIEIFDPDIQCYAGECEPMGNKEYMRITTMVENLKIAGKDIIRYNPMQEPSLYKEMPEIRQLMDEKGIEALPAVMLDGKIVKSGEYPSNKELLDWSGLSQEELVKTIMQKKMSNCKCGNDLVSERIGKACRSSFLNKKLKNLMSVSKKFYTMTG